jgi:hypothetical protein
VEGENGAAKFLQKSAKLESNLIVVARELKQRLLFSTFYKATDWQNAALFN